MLSQDDRYQGLEGENQEESVCFSFEPGCPSISPPVSREFVSNPLMEWWSCFHLLSPYKELWLMESELSLQFDLQMPHCHKTR